MIRKCPFCERIVKNDPHIYSCDKRTTEDKKEIKFLFISKNFPYISIKNNIEKEYEDKSLVDLKKLFEIDFKSTLFLLDYYGIKKRNISDSSKIITTKKYKDTCLEKYGVDNASKSEIIKDKKKNTFLKNYGVDNIWKSKEYYEWLHKYMLENYGKKSLPNRYGKMDDYYKTLTLKEKQDKMDIPRKVYLEHWYNLNDEEKTAMIQKRNKFVSTKIESLVSETLNKLNISHTNQYWIKRRSYDFRIENTNILIEVQGDFWHGNPSIYKKDDIIQHPFKSVVAEDLWEKDMKKKLLAENGGYDLIYIWEKELKDNKNNLLDFIIKKIDNVKKI